MNGAGEGNMSGLEVNTLIVTLSGAGKMNMAGTVTDQTITISGAGDYQAGDLKSQNTTMTINGAGKGTLNVSSILNATINGTGEISYLGNPQVNRQINGAGTGQADNHINKLYFFIEENSVENNHDRQIKSTGKDSPRRRQRCAPPRISRRKNPYTEPVPGEEKSSPMTEIPTLQLRSRG